MSKPWYQSKTVLGLAAAAIGALLALAGAPEAVWGPIVAVGLTGAGFGRAVAQGPLTGRLWAALAAVPLALLVSGCAIGAGGFAFGQSATCSGVYSERYTEDGWLAEASCDGEYVAGGRLSENALAAGRGTAEAASVVLPPLVTGAP